MDNDPNLGGPCLTSPVSLPSFSVDHSLVQRPFGVVSACGDTSHRIQILSCLTHVSVIGFWEGVWAILPDCLELKPTIILLLLTLTAGPLGTRSFISFPFHPHFRFSSCCTQCCSPIPRDSPSVSFKTSSMPLPLGRRDLLPPFLQIALGVEGSGLFHLFREAFANISGLSNQIPDCCGTM